MGRGSKCQLDHFGSLHRSLEKTLLTSLVASPKLGHSLKVNTPGAQSACEISLKTAKPRSYPTDPQTIGDHLKKRRYELGLRRKDVAAELHVNEFTVCGWENNKKEPSVRYLPRIIEFLGYCPFPDAQMPGEQLLACRRCVWRGCLAGRWPSGSLWTRHACLFPARPQRCRDYGERVYPEVRDDRPAQPPELPHLSETDD